jgi:GDPmannose 4,6-dehydratase
MKTALITGVSGQDGAYLALLLLSKGYRVYGASRDANISTSANLAILGVESLIQRLSINLIDFRSVLQGLNQATPDEVYNLAGQSSVGLSFEQPVETLESIATGTLNLLEAIRFTGRPIRLYSAGSSECFGDTGTLAANEETLFRPRSPYAVAKATAFWEVANYREAYSLFACTGILFNHESPLRGSRFVTRKIVQTACRIAAGSKERLRLGNIEISRDWGWAPEYVDAMWRMLQQPNPDDFVIATGKTHRLDYFIELVFGACGLDWRDWVYVDESLFRPTDLREGHADPSKAARELSWCALVSFEEIVRRMVAVERGQLSVIDASSLA